MSVSVDMGEPGLIRSNGGGRCGLDRALRVLVNRSPDTAISPQSYTVNPLLRLRLGPDASRIVCRPSWGPQAASVETPPNTGGLEHGPADLPGMSRRIAAGSEVLSSPGSVQPPPTRALPRRADLLERRGDLWQLLSEVLLGQTAGCHLQRGQRRLDLLQAGLEGRRRRRGRGLRLVQIALDLGDRGGQRRDAVLRRVSRSREPGATI